MTQIWKYPHTDGGQPPLEMGMNVVKIKQGARFLTAINQHRSIVLHALVEPASEDTEVRIFVAGTGFDIPNEVLTGFNYLGTVAWYDGTYMWHVFVEKGWIYEHRG